MMAEPECMRCGKCCLADMAALAYQIDEEDRKRWIGEGRADILHIIENEHPVWMGDHLISSRTGNPLHGCQFLARDGNRFFCTIYETRPLACRDFIPGSSELCPLFYGKGPVTD